MVPNLQVLQLLVYPVFLYFFLQLYQLLSLRELAHQQRLSFFNSAAAPTNFHLSRIFTVVRQTFDGFIWFRQPGSLIDFLVALLVIFLLSMHTVYNLLHNSNAHFVLMRILHTIYYLKVSVKKALWYLFGSSK